MERKMYLSAKDYGDKSVAIIHEHKAWNDFDIIVVSHTDIGFYAWELQNLCNWDIITSKEQLISFLLDNDSYGCSCGMYDSYEELCDDVGMNVDADIAKYFAN